MAVTKVRPKKGGPVSRHVKSALKRDGRKATQCLLRVDAGQLDQVSVYKLTAKGFATKDVRDMLSLSKLLDTNQIMSRIVGKSVRTLQRQGNNQPANLSPQQSAVALQYAKVLEQAINVFGSQELAEDWLGRPCKYLGGVVPLDVIDNPVGFQTVEDYLERVRYGVYQ